MALTLYMHPLASFCWKVLIALYENDTPFTPELVDLADPAQREAFNKLWPIGKFPLLRDQARGQLVPESSIIIEYLQQHYPGRNTRLIPADADLARDVRLRDRFYDRYVHEPMQKIVLDKLRQQDQRDGYGVEEAKGQLRASYDIIEGEMADRLWAMGGDFSMADCSASPALYYANLVVPLGTAHPNVAAYLERLKQRPSFARVLAEAQPYFAMFPG